MRDTRIAGRWRVGFAAVAAVAVLHGCTSPGTHASNGETGGAEPPGVEETKAIAEEGVHLRPAAGDELRRDVRLRGEQELRPVQGAVQPDRQRGAGLHIRRHRRHRAEQRHAVLGRCRRTSAPSRWCCRCRRWRGGATTRCNSATPTPSTTATSAVARRETIQETTWWPGRSGRARSLRHPGGVPVVDAVLPCHLQNPALRPRGHAERAEGAVRVPRAAALGLSGATCSAGRGEHRLPADRQVARPNQLPAVPGFRAPVRAPRSEEAPIRARLARIGVGAPGSVSLNALSPEHKAAVALGLKEGARKVSEAVEQISRKVNGWNVGSPFGDRAFYNGDWLRRAAAAQSGIYGNSAAEAVYPMTKSDADGEPLDGNRYAYTLTFARRAASARQRVLVHHDVRRQDAVARPEPDRPLSDQLAHAPVDEEGPRRLAHHLHPEGFALEGAGLELASRAGRAHLRRDAALLAEDRAAVHLAAG